MTSFQVARYFAILIPRAPVRVTIRALTGLVGSGMGRGFGSLRSYILAIDVNKCGRGTTLTHVSLENRTMSTKTTAPYIEPMP